jgi:hypothetical protein
MSAGIEPGRLLTTRQVAGLTSYDEGIVIRWIAGGLPHIVPRGKSRPGHKDIRIRSSVLREWIGELEVKRVAPPGRVRDQAKVSLEPRPKSDHSAWRRHFPGMEKQG